MRHIIILAVFIAVVLMLSSCGNKPPSKPTLDGSSTVLPGVPDTFLCVTTDPDGDNIRYQLGYRIEGGQENTTNYGDLVPSGTEYKIGLTLEQAGNYFLRCRAKDQKGKESKWSDVFSVSCGFGIMKWWFTCYDPQEDYGEFNGTPAIDDQGNIYVGCTMGHIHCLRPNGTERWRYPVADNDEIISSVAIAPNGTIYACSRYDMIYAINPDGTLKWQKDINAEIVASPAVGPNSEIYIVTINEGLFAFSSQGNLLNAFRYGYINGISSVSIDHSQNLYIGTEGGYLYSLDSTGALRWSEPFDAGDEIVSSPAITPTGKICFGTQSIDSNFIILNPNKTVFKKLSLGWSISASPVIGTDGSIYIATEEGVLYKINANGTIDWSFVTNGTFASSPAVVRYPQYGDVVYFRVSWTAKKMTLKSLQEDTLDFDTLYFIKSDRTRLGFAIIPPVQNNAEFISSPMIGADGTIYIGGGYYEPEEPAEPYGGLYAFSGRGVLASSSWPLFRQNKKNTGRIE